MWGEGVSEGGESDGVTTQRSHSGRVRRKRMEAIESTICSFFFFK